MNDNNDPVGEQAGSFAQCAAQASKMWTEFANKAFAAATSVPPGTTPPDAARQFRSAFLHAWAAYCDEFMRSSEFLELMKQSMRNAIEFRQQLNQFLGRMHHEFQGTSRQDVDQLMLAIRHVEQRLTDSMDRLSARVDQLAAHTNGGAAGRVVPSPASADEGSSAAKPAPRSGRGAGKAAQKR